MYKKILEFCFEEVGSQQFFEKDLGFDRLLQERFGDLLVQASAAEFSHWRSSVNGRLAEIIVLDQFSRNIYRDTAAAFAQDGMALVLAQEAVAANDLQQLTTIEARNFLLMPYMHSESKVIHEQALSLFEKYTSPETVQAEIKHKVIIDRSFWSLSASQ